MNPSNTDLRNLVDAAGTKEQINIPWSSPAFSTSMRPYDLFKSYYGRNTDAELNQMREYQNSAPQRYSWDWRNLKTPVGISSINEDYANQIGQEHSGAKVNAAFVPAAVSQPRGLFARRSILEPSKVLLSKGKMEALQAVPQAGGSRLYANDPMHPYNAAWRTMRHELGTHAMQDSSLESPTWSVPKGLESFADRDSYHKYLARQIEIEPRLADVQRLFYQLYGQRAHSPEEYDKLLERLKRNYSSGSNADQDKLRSWFGDPGAVWYNLLFNNPEAHNAFREIAPGIGKTDDGGLTPDVKYANINMTNFENGIKLACQSLGLTDKAEAKFISLVKKCAEQTIASFLAQIEKGADITVSTPEQLYFYKQAIELYLEKAAVIREESCTDSGGNGGSWVLYSHDGSKKLGCHSSKDSALAQERAIQASKHASDKSAYAYGTTLPENHPAKRIFRKMPGKINQLSTTLQPATRPQRLPVTPKERTVNAKKYLIPQATSRPSAIKNLWGRLASSKRQAMSTASDTPPISEMVAYLQRLVEARKPAVPSTAPRISEDRGGF